MEYTVTEYQHLFLGLSKVLREEMSGNRQIKNAGGLSWAPAL